MTSESSDIYEVTDHQTAPPPDGLVIPQYYQYDLRQSTWRDWTNDSHWLLWPIAFLVFVLTRFLRISMVYHPYDLLTEPTSACISNHSDWPEKVLEILQPRRTRLQATEFTELETYHSTYVDVDAAIYVMALRDTKSSTIALLRFHLRKRSRHDLILISQVKSGDWLVTRDRSYDAFAWPEYDLAIFRGAEIDDLVQAHRDRTANRRLRSIPDRETMCKMVHDYHDGIREKAREQGLLEKVVSIKRKEFEWFD